MLLKNSLNFMRMVTIESKLIVTMQIVLIQSKSQNHLYSFETNKVSIFNAFVHSRYSACVMC